MASVAQTAATDGVGHRRLIVAASNSPETQDSLSPLEADSALTGFSLSSGEQALHFVRLLCSLPKQKSAAAAADNGDPSMLLYSAQRGSGTGCYIPSNGSQSITSAHPPPHATETPPVPLGASQQSTTTTAQPDDNADVAMTQESLAPDPTLPPDGVPAPASTPADPETSADAGINVDASCLSPTRCRGTSGQ